MHCGEELVLTTSAVRLGLVACVASSALAKPGDEQEPEVAAVRTVEVFWHAYRPADRA